MMQYTCLAKNLHKKNLVYGFKPLEFKLQIYNEFGLRRLLHALLRSIMPENLHECCIVAFFTFQNHEEMPDNPMLLPIYFFGVGGGGMRNSLVDHRP